MLYIFLEDPGIMVKFEMTFALESVATLKKAIEERCHIPASEQILLISGGERLEDNQRVGKYHTGTDNNPIFLFRDVANSPPPSVVDVNEYLQDLSESVNAVLDLPPTIRTVISRSALAQKLCISAQEQLRLAEGLIHDQHLQQQGWAAVLAHLDDMIVYYSAMCSACEKTYVQFLDIRDTFVDLLNSFNEDLTRISKLPVLPALLTSDEIEPPDSGMSLLDWITSHKDGDNDQTLAEVASFCSRSIQILDQKLMSKVAELREYIKIAESNYRDVKVIETKLEHLDQVMHASKRIVQDQISQAQTFNSNKTSAIKEQDASILKELCTFHREWLLVMESNHTQLCKNLKTCASYKSDLCAYLQTRLQWVRKMFSDMRDTNEYVYLYYKSIEKLRAHYDFLQSLRSTPAMYVCAVSEVIRRRAFSQAYLVWANDLSCQLLAITSEEVSRRKKFQEQFEGHFLDKLFPGLDEFPPTYATQAPESFDSSLPKLTIFYSNIIYSILLFQVISWTSCFQGWMSHFLDKLFPGLDEFPPTYATQAPESFDSSLPKLTIFYSNIIYSILLFQVISWTSCFQGWMSHFLDKLFPGLDEFPPTYATQAPESFDSSLFKLTIFYSNIIYSILLFQVISWTSCFQGWMSHFLDKLFPGLDEFPPTYATQAPESFDSSLPKLTFEDMEVLKQFLPELGLSMSLSEPTSFSHLFFLRSVQDTLTLNQTSLTQHQHSASVEDRIVQVVTAAGLASNLDTTLLRCDSEGTDTEEFEKLRHSGQTVSECSESNETIRANMRQLGQDANQGLGSLRLELAQLKQDVVGSQTGLMEDFAHSMSEVTRVLKERERTILHLTQILGMKESELCTLRSQVKEITESLKRSHRAEMDNLRSRYKLMTCSNMERSPSDTSLEKIETNHELIVAQLRENFEVEKEKLLAEERQKWSEKLEADLKQYKVWYNESMRQTLSEHSAQLEAYRKREEALVSEVQRFESRLRHNPNEDLLRRIETLEREKAELEADLRGSFSHSEALSTSSVSIYEAASSPLHRRAAEMRERVGRVVSAGGGLRLSVTTCRPGDIVLVLWNDLRRYFYIHSATDQLYLLHPDCVPVTYHESLKEYGFVAEVIASEYCRVKK
ncbi:hypothetical protein M8J76_008973, partial [Diaphorina citri]